MSFASGISSGQSVEVYECILNFFDLGPDFKNGVELLATCPRKTGVSCLLPLQLIFSSDVKHTTLGWILETVSAFLKSPDYVVPVMNFIDEKCMCFDDAEENHLELTSIHQEFIALVFRL